MDFEKIGVYYEFSLGKHCFKYTPHGLPIIIISNESQEKAKGSMVIEILKSVHYELRYHLESGNIEYLKKRLETFRSWEDINVNQTIGIWMRSVPADIRKQFQ